MSDYKHIKVNIADGLGEVVFAKEPLNVLNIEMMKEINSALTELATKDDLKVVVLKAEGKAFSAGVDVGEHMGDSVKEMIEIFHNIFRNLDRIEVPTVALVNGAALGGGCEVATYCDLVIASEKAKFGQPEIQVGVFPPIAALAFPKMMHMKKALELVMTGQIIKADEAHKVGLVNQVYPVESFDEDAKRFLSQLTAQSAVVLRLTKKATYLGGSLESGQLEKIEDIYLNDLMKTEDANEGLKAFLEKRKPVWKDR